MNKINIEIKEKLVVYPFDSEFSPVLRHQNLLENYQVAGLVSPGGWGLKGKDAGYADGGSKVGMVVTDKLENALDDCDTVLFTQPRLSLDFDRIVYPKMLKALDCGKNIICTMSLYDDIKKHLTGISNARGLYFKDFSRINLTSEKAVEYEHILDIHTPVIFVMGVSERVHKFEIQLALRENLVQMGYRVSQIGTRNYCELLGFHSFPPFMLDTSLPGPKRVVLFNHYVKKLELEEKPDVIIIGVPGGIIPINNQFTNRFGILAYEISQAVKADTGILSTTYEDFKSEYFEGLATSTRYKFGVRVDCFNLSNAIFNWNESREMNSEVLTILDSGFVDEKVSKLNAGILKTPVYNILNPHDSGALSNCIVDRLGGYAEVEAL